MSQAAVEFHDVSKTFALHRGQLLIRHRLANWFTGASGERFSALKRVSFDLFPGESLGVIGANGAGKSTLLGLVAGLAEPDEGSVAVRGRVAALLELGSGFHPDLTGAENIRLNASLLGMSRKRTMDLFDEIVEFSGVGDFIDQPLRTYSSGMMVRLAFSVAINTDPEILVIDEVLVVGDMAFQSKCMDRIFRFRDQGKTILCVSHATGMVRSLCDRAIWLDHGELVMSGAASEVIDAYEGRRTPTPRSHPASRQA